jgi:hypothetical protein
LRQLTLHLLGIQETALVHFVLLLREVDGPATVLRAQLLRILLEVVLHLAHHALSLSPVQSPFGLLTGPRVVFRIGGVIQTFFLVAVEILRVEWLTGMGW